MLVSSCKSVEEEKERRRGRERREVGEEAGGSVNVESMEKLVGFWFTCEMCFMCCSQT